MVNATPAVPDHELLRPIGRGAYGEVWLARNVMGVPRAVKIVERRNFDSDRPYEREFAGIQRYEPVSRLTDGLVHVLHVGRNDAAGYFYYVMELADAAPQHDGRGEEDKAATGAENTSPLSPPSSANLPPLPFSAAEYQPRTLRSDLKRLHRLPTADCLRVALDVVGGLTKLHEQGLVHRDVKPGNIIFVNGRAKLADIGLVSAKGEGRTFVGTEGYIPPEGPGSPAADLYALGIALYEACTSFPPDRFPMVPSDWFTEAADSHALEFYEVVLKACEGARERRYQHAEEMQADLALLQSGQSVRHLRTLERRVKRWRRIGWAAGIAVALAVFTAFVAGWRAKLAAESRQKESRLLLQAQASLARAENAERQSRQQLYAALFEQARALVLSKELGHRTRALEALRKAAGATNVAELRRIAFAAFALPDLRLEREVPFDPDVTLLQPDHEFERVALARGRSSVTILSFPTLEPQLTLPASTNREAYVGLWSRDGRFLAVKRQHDRRGGRADWEIWNLPQTQSVVVASPDIAHNSVTFHPQQPLFMAAHGGGRVTEWDLENCKPARSFKFPNTAHALAYSPDGKRLVACYRKEGKWVIAFHDAITLDVLRTVDLAEPIEFVVWHPKGRWVTGNGANASAWSRGVRLIEADTGKITTLGEHKIKTASSGFTANGDYLISGGWDREMICWDLHTFQRAFTYAGTGFWQMWSADGTRCAVALQDGIIQTHAFEQPHDRALTGNPGEALQAARFSPDGRWLAAPDSQSLCVWDMRSNAPAAVIPLPRRATAFFSPDSTELFAVPDEYRQQGYLGRWRVTASAEAGGSPRVEALPLKIPEKLTHAVAVADQLVITSPEGVHFVALTNLATGTGRAVPIRPGLGFVSPDGQWLAMLYDYSPLVGVYRLPEVEPVAQLQTSNLVGFITFSPASDEMLVLNRSGAEWFDTTTWRRTRRQAGSPVSGAYAFYTPDGNGIWMVTHFRHAALLDRHTLEPRLPLPNDVLPLALSPDGRQLVVSVEGRRAQLWDLHKFHLELAKLGLAW